MTQLRYISVRQAAEREGCHISWIRYLCRECRIPGAYKMGSTWAIPEGFTIEDKSPWERNHLTAAEAAVKLCMTTERVIQLCRAGRIVGAKKIGNKWAIPKPIQRIVGRPGRRSASERQSR